MNDNFNIPFWHGTGATVSSLTFTPNPGDSWIAIVADVTTNAATITQAASAGPAMVAASAGNFPNYSDGTDTWGLAWQIGATGGGITTSIAATTGDNLWGIGFGWTMCQGIYDPAITSAAAPGSGAGALSGTAVTPTAGDTLFVFVCQTSAGAFTPETITPANLSSTPRGYGVFLNQNTQKLWAAFEYLATGSAMTPTFTLSSGARTYVVLQCVVQAAANASTGWWT